VALRRRAREKGNSQGWLAKGDKVYIAEMLAYSLAAAVLDLPHSVAPNMAVTSVDSCSYPHEAHGCEPRLLHYCYPQNVRTPQGHWIFNKYRMPSSFGAKGSDQWQQPLFMDCDMPLLEEPEEPNSGSGLTGRQLHIFWMIGQITRSYNLGAQAIKTRHCTGENRAELRKLLRVDEDSWYVRANTSPEMQLFTQRIREHIRENVTDLANDRWAVGSS
jgi:hypothetical protein